MTKRRSKAVAERLEEGRLRLIEQGETVPFYESMTSKIWPMHPEGFRENHKSRHEWKLLKRRVEPAEIDNYVALIAGWWHGQPGRPADWCPVYRIDQTKPLPRSPDALREKLKRGEKLTTSEAKILNSHDWAL